MIKSLKRNVKRIIRRRPNFGDLAGTKPLSRKFGFDRGTPIDRYYIDQFLSANAEAIHGRTLEIGDDAYTRHYGGARTTQRDVLHIHADNPRATIVGDMSVAGTLPEAAFDCAVITQTLHLIYDMRSALEQLHRSLKPGGTLLLTVPYITQIASDEWGKGWLWSLTPEGAERLVGDVFGHDRIEVRSWGNVFAAIGFLSGVAVEEVPKAKLDVFDAAYPVTVAVRATRA